MRLERAAMLALHRELVATPSVSGDEVAIVALLSSFLESQGATIERVGGSLVAWTGKAPAKGDVEGVALVVLNTHVDTVPPAPGWTREPFSSAPARADGKVFGLGSNDAKAAVVAMTAAFLAVADVGLPFTLALSARSFSV